MALDLQFGLEEYAGAFALNGEDGALAVSSGRQGRAYLVSASKVVDAAASTSFEALTTYARPWRPLDTASAPSSPLRAKAPAYSSNPNWRSRAMVVAACCGWQF